MFRQYVSKPIYRRAHKIVEKDEITKVEGSVYTVIFYNHPQSYDFKSKKKVRIGDYIVGVEGSLYHVPKEEFEGKFKL